MRLISARGLDYEMMMMTSYRRFAVKAGCCGAGMRERWSRRLLFQLARPVAVGSMVL